MAPTQTLPPDRPKRVGRRVFIGMVAAGAAGIVFGARIQNVVGNAIGSGLGGLLPGGDRFRFYTVTGSFPYIPDRRYRLEVKGLVDHPVVLTLDQARRPDVIVAYRMLGAPITSEHGGPVRLYVAPMYGYKSLKWLSAIRVVDDVQPGYWEQNGYAVDAWIGSSNGGTEQPVD